MTYRRSSTPGCGLNLSCPIIRHILKDKPQAGATRISRAWCQSIYHYLDALKLDDFDPSVSPTLRPEDIRDGCSVPFWWRINAMHFRDYTLEQVRDFVFNAVAGGASGVFASVGRIMTTAEAAIKLKVFMHAAQHVEALLNQDIPPDQVVAHRLPVSQYG